jgi:hypothetical protein
MLIRANKIYQPGITDTALKMALEIENSLNFMTAIKQITAQEQQAINRLKKDIRKLFDDAFNDTLDRLEIMGYTPSNDSQRNRVVQTIVEIEDDYKEIQAEYAEVSAARGNNWEIKKLRNLGIEVIKEELSDHVLEMIREHSFVASDFTMDRLEGDVMKVLAKSYEEGIGIKETAERLTSEFDDMKTHQLNTISRTKTISFQNERQFISKQQNNISYHQWWTGQDERVRGNPAGLYPDSKADHWELHGQIVKVGDDFANGLKYPGDRTGGQATISEWINCRCRSVAFIMPDGKGAPPNKTYFYEDDLIDILPAA